MRFLFPVLIIITLLSSCSKYDKLLKEGTVQERLAMANEMFDKGNYFKAVQLYDALMVELRGQPQFEEVYYRYAWCHYHQEQFLMAAYYFKSLTKNLPTSKYAEESLYMAAYCQYLESAEPSLDQSPTNDALNEFQLFVNRYPNSDKVAKCNELMDELRFKLETKAFNTAKLYYQIEEYKAAIVSLSNVIKDYPATAYKEEVMFLLIKANYFYAAGSIESKKKERFMQADLAFKKFEAQFPESAFLKEARSLNEKINQQLSKLN